MGFGSYDESEQENRDIDTDFDEDTVSSSDSHDGNVSFEFDTSNDELLERLEEMKE
ncbi:DUF5786 family protein [Halocatena marina]|uniref:DUF5786 family protein n=1 Tax=Halocatena marina TaxID=2934937 RepID=A0ABD5YJD9_9EURY|nr:DUF5786 family protein [Halocatena marina]